MSVCLLLTNTFVIFLRVLQPFGQGLVTVILSTLRRGGENSLFLWNLDSLVTPVHTFMGHSDVVVEFQWRKKKQGMFYYFTNTVLEVSLFLWNLDSLGTPVHTFIGRSDVVVEF